MPRVHHQNIGGIKKLSKLHRFFVLSNKNRPCVKSVVQSDPTIVSLAIKRATGIDFNLYMATSNTKGS